MGVDAAEVSGASVADSKSSTQDDASGPTLTFPAFRTKKWIKNECSKLKAPPEVLAGVDLSPQYMTSFPTIGLYPGKVAEAREEIRTALFRQAVLKVQNVEVTYMDECRELRVIKNVMEQMSPSLLGRAAGKVLDSRQPSDVSLMRQENWTIDRCGQDANYNVRFYKEGVDGFSAAVVPVGLRDMWRAYQFDRSTSSSSSSPSDAASRS